MPAAGPQPRLSRKKRLLFSGVLTLVLLLLAEGCSGLYLRRIATYSEVLERFGPIYPVARSDYLPFTTPHGITVTARDPSHGAGDFGRIEFNAFGYRGPDPATVAKPAGVKRLLVLGDSFVLGWGVLDETQTIPGHLRGMLGGGERWEVVNAGYRAGASPDAYYAYLRREGIELAPDAVALVLFTANDFDDVATNLWTDVDELGGPRAMRTIRMYTNHTGGVLDPAMLPWQFHVPVLCESRLFLGAVRAWDKLARGGELELRKIGEQASPEDAWRRFAACTKAKVEFLRARQVPIVYVAFADIGQPLAADAQHARIRQLLVDECKVPFAALHDRLGAEHMLPNDQHTNGAGNRIIAAAIHELLATTRR
jgi:hypothetical protein